MSARCYQKKKERPQKKFEKGIKIFHEQYKNLSEDEKTKAS